MMKLAYFILLSALLSGCASSVSRDDAAAIIKSTFSLPHKETRIFYSAHIEVKSIVPYTDTMMWIQMLGRGERYLVEKGLRSAHIIAESQTAQFVPDYMKVLNLQFTTGNPAGVATFTSDGKGIAQYDVPVATYALDAINSLRKVSDTEYEVECSITVSPNEPYYEAYQQGICTPTGMPKPKQLPTSEQFKALKFRILKYDNGWGIDKDQGKEWWTKYTMAKYMDQ